MAKNRYCQHSFANLLALPNPSFLYILSFAGFYPYKINESHIIRRSIRFILEFEDESKIAYLDMLHHRKPDGTLMASHYTKPTSKNRLLNYHSAHPSHQIIGTAYGTISRILGITSKEFLKQSIGTIIYCQ